MQPGLQVANSTSRTTVRFRVDPQKPLLPAIASWAPRHGYKLHQDGANSDARRLYQKGSGFWVAPMMLEVLTDGDDVTLTAGVRINLFTRIMSFGILPAEMPVQSGGLRAVVPRNMARKAVNELLGDLGQPPIN